MRRFLPILVFAAAAAAADPDSDGDGLSDFQETHKYLTDPARKDSDGDGAPDGDWNERREHAYTVRVLVRVLRPAAAVSDDHQDARVVEEGPGHVTIEVISYPLSSSPVGGDAAGREEDLAEWLRPGLTSNGDEELKAKILAGLEAEGVRGTDWQAVATWLLRHARYEGSHFTTFITEFADGKPRLARWAAPEGPPVGEQWKRDLFAKEMFFAGERGSCTSSAIYLAGCLRAVGLPTRLIYCIPPVDATDPAQTALLRQLTHHAVRKTLVAAAGGLGGWTSHTMNEVFVGGRWRRLNYERLAPPPLDEHAFGLILPVLTLHDWADARMADTVGRRQTLDERDELFPNVNPYVTLELSDAFGVHAKVANDPVAEPEEFKQLTIVKAFWYADRPPGHDMRGLDDASGHVFFQVKENRDGGGVAQYKPFYDVVDKEFVLKAEGHPDVPARAERGYWGSGVFYLRIEPEALGRMAKDAPYALVPRNGAGECKWAVADGVTLARVDEFRTLTIDRIVWSDSLELPKGMREALGDRLVLLAHVKEWDGFEKMKRFTATADPEFVLEADGHPPVRLRAATGGITDGDGATRFVVLVPEGEPARRVAYELRPMNGKPPYAWKLALAVTRE